MDSNYFSNGSVSNQFNWVDNIGHSDGGVRHKLCEFNLRHQRS
jgi:hypothetical protein